MNTLEARFAKLKTVSMRRDPGCQYAMVLEHQSKNYTNYVSYEDIFDLSTRMVMGSFEEKVPTMHVVQKFTTKDYGTAMNLLPYVDPSDLVVILHDVALVKSKASAAFLAEFKPITSKEIPSYEWSGFVEDTVKAQGFEASIDAITELSRRLPCSVSELWLQLQCLEVLNGKKKFSIHDVNGIVIDSSGNDIFSVVQDFMRSRRKSFFNRLSLMQESELYKLAVFMAKDIQRTYAAKVMLDGGMYPSDVAAALGMNTYIFEKTIKAYAKVYSVNTLFAMNGIFTKAPDEILLTKKDKRSYLESLVFKVWQ